MLNINELVLSDLRKYTDSKTGRITLPLKIHLEATNLTRERIEQVLQDTDWEKAVRELKEEVLEDFYFSDFDLNMSEKIVCKYLSDDTLFRMSREAYDLTDIIADINFQFDYSYIYMNLPDNIQRASKGIDLSSGPKSKYIGE